MIALAVRLFLQKVPRPALAIVCEFGKTCLPPFQQRPRSKEVENYLIYHQWKGQRHASWRGMKSLCSQCGAYSLASVPYGLRLQQLECEPFWRRVWQWPCSRHRRVYHKCRKCFVLSFLRICSTPGTCAIEANFLNCMGPRTSTYCRTVLNVFSGQDWASSDGEFSSVLRVPQLGTLTCARFCWYVYLCWKFV